MSNFAVKKEGNHYFYLVDFFRGVGAYAILIWHYHHFYFTKPYFGPSSPIPEWSFERQPLYDLLWVFYQNGMLAVHFFWLLSGFVFAFVYLGRKVTAKTFFILRFSRLYPLHFCTLLSVALMQFVSLALFQQYQFFEINDLKHFVLNLFFAQHWGLQDGYSFNAPSWSVSLEELVYWGFWLLILKPGLTKIWASSILVVWFYCLYKSYGIYMYAFFYFFLGVLIFQIQSKLGAITSMAFGAIVFILTALIGLSIFKLEVISTLLNSEFPLLLRGDLKAAFYALFFSSVIIVAASIDRMNILRPSANAFCKTVGSLTYSTYMLHVPVQILIVLVFEAFSLHRGLFDHPISLFLFLILMTWLGLKSYRQFELPMQQFIRRKFTAKIVST